MNLRVITQARLQCLLSALAQSEELPAHIEVTPISEVYCATVYDEVSSALVPESVSTGIANDSSLALLKALVESIERKVLWEGYYAGNEACFAQRSDGFAAYPKLLHLQSTAKQHARQNAYFEACERFVWSYWWDNPKFAHESSVLDLNVEPQLSSLVNAICDATPIKCFHLIEPILPESTSVKVCVIFAELSNGGFISGGAAGLPNKRSQILFRAMSELLRHSLAIQRIKARKIELESFYEERLAFFGLGHGDQYVRERMNTVGYEGIVFPKLKFDTEIPHHLDHLVAVHRCYFENQPPFVGGALERLCI